MIHSNFLFQGDTIGMTLLLPAYPLDEACDRIDRVAANGYTDIDLYACNRGDNPFGQSHHATDAAVNDGALMACCAHARDAGLGVTLWGFADDSHWTLEEALAKQAVFLPRLAPRIDRYVVALEGNETFGFSGVKAIVTSAANFLGARPALLPVPMFLHWTHGEVGGASWDAVRGLYYQYEASTPADAEIETRTQAGKWHNAGKLFVAGEFKAPLSQDDARLWGDAAVRGGADGSACGARA